MYSTYVTYYLYVIHSCVCVFVCTCVCCEYVWVYMYVRVYMYVCTCVREFRAVHTYCIIYIDVCIFTCMCMVWCARIMSALCMHLQTLLCTLYVLHWGYCSTFFIESITQPEPCGLCSISWTFAQYSRNTSHFKASLLGSSLFHSFLAAQWQLHIAIHKWSVTSCGN